MPSCGISRATRLWLIPYPCVRSQAVIRPNAIQRGRRVLSIEQPHQMEGLRTYLVSLIIQTRPREAQQGTLASHTDLGKTADNDIEHGVLMAMETNVVSVTWRCESISILTGWGAAHTIGSEDIIF